MILLAKVKQVKEVANRGRVFGNVGIAFAGFGVRQIVAAPSTDGPEAPVALDELDNRRMVGIFVRNVPGLGVWRDHDKRDARSVAEKVQRLHVNRIVVAIALIHGVLASSVASQFPIS